MRVAGILALMLGLAVAAPAASWGESWGGIEPGQTTIGQLRERYGAPSKETKQKTEGYDTVTWIYEGDHAPAGMIRMTVDLGLLKPDGFKPDVVRVFVLEPKPTIFPVQVIIDGWGRPTGGGEQGGFPTMFFESGLFVVFEQKGQWASTMTFTIPQPLLAPTAGAASGSGPASKTPQAPTPRAANPAPSPAKPPVSPAAPRP
jgi:hypothetical protein